MNQRERMNLCLLFVTSLIIMFTTISCSSVGPDLVKRDRFDYNTAVATSWKEQMLLNIVKLRYADVPLFLEVSSIIAGYTFEGEIRGGSNILQSGNAFDIGASGKFTDRPTITYTPITGQEFNKSFMTPIPPAAVLFLLQTGWQAELVIPIAVDAINGLRSRDASGTNQYKGDDEFYEVIKLLGHIQRANAIGMQIITKNEKETALIVVRRDGLSPEVQADLEKLDRLLGLDPSVSEFEVVYQAVPKSGTEIAMLTRSMLHIMIEMAGQIEVPEKDILEGRTVRSNADSSAYDGKAGILNIRSSEEQPELAFVSVWYRDRFFYIDDSDYPSKSSFTFVMLLNSMLETGGREGLPLVTIPSQ